MPPVALTILNSQAGADSEAALDQHVAWNLRFVDLKEAIYGKSIAELSVQEAEEAAQQIAARNLKTYCLSTVLFGEDLALGESDYVRTTMDQAEKLRKIAQILKPQHIRLLAPQFAAASSDRLRAALHDAPWIVKLYRDVIDGFIAGGTECFIENEVHACILSTPDDVLELFKVLGYQTGLKFTWDTQNMWQAGSYPTMDAYMRMKPLIGFVHVKGGRSEVPGGPLVWRSSLADASWPVKQIVSRVCQDGVSPVICINPSHGTSAGGAYVDYCEDDINYLRSAIPEVE